jgi:protein MpaA
MDVGQDSKSRHLFSFLSLVRPIVVYNNRLFLDMSKGCGQAMFAGSKKYTIALKVCVLFPILVFAGCYQPTEYPQIVTTLPAKGVPAPAIPTQYRIAGTSVQGRPIMYTVLGQGPDVTLIVAAIHGNEPAGTALVRRLAEHLKQNQHLLQGRMVVLLPVANPDGAAYNTRYNANKVDLNRNFATANRINNTEFGRTALSEPETSAIYQLLWQYNPDRIVSIHQSMGCIDYDGPSYGLASRMAQYCNLPIKKLGAKPGSLGSYAGLTLGVPIITLELSQSDSGLGSENLWRQYGKALLAAVTYPETVASK